MRNFLGLFSLGCTALGSASQDQRVGSFRGDTNDGSICNPCSEVVTFRETVTIPVTAGGVFTITEPSPTPFMTTTIRSGASGEILTLPITETIPETIFEESPCSSSFIFPDGSLTGVTVQSTPSPATCYSLPTPTCSLDVISLSAAEISTNAQSESDAVLFYFGNNFTVPQYLATVIDGDQYLLDASYHASAARRITLTIPGKESLVFDQTGMHYFDAACSSGFAVLVDGFIEQIAAMINDTVPCTASGRPARKRQLPIMNFTVVIQVEDAMGSQFQQPQVSFGPSPCSFLYKIDNGGWSTYEWSCEHPGEESAEKQCQRSLQAWLRPANGTLPTLPDDSSFYLLRFISKAGPALTSLFPAISSPFTTGLRWLSNVESAIANIVEFAGEDICERVHAQDEYILALSDPGMPSVHTIGVYVTPPVSVISHTIASITTQSTRQPPRVVQPSPTGFPTVTVTSFSPIIFGSSAGISGHGGAAMLDTVVDGTTSAPVTLATTSKL